MCSFYLWNYTLLNKNIAAIVYYSGDIALVEMRGVEPLSEDKSVQLSTSVAIVLGFPRRIRPIAG